MTDNLCLLLGMRPRDWLATDNELFVPLWRRRTRRMCRITASRSPRVESGAIRKRVLIGGLAEQPSSRPHGPLLSHSLGLLHFELW